MSTLWFATISGGFLGATLSLGRRLVEIRNQLKRIADAMEANR